MGGMAIGGVGRHTLAFWERHIEIPRVALVETRGFELQRDHVKPISFRQSMIGPVQQVRGLCGHTMADMGRKCVFAAGQRPGMHMVNVQNPVLAAQVRRHSLEIRSLWRAFHEDVDRFLDDADGGPEENHPERHAEDRVNRQKAGELDH